MVLYFSKLSASVTTKIRLRRAGAGWKGTKWPGKEIICGPGLNSGAGKILKGTFQDNWWNLNMCCVLDNSIALMLNFLNMIIVLGWCKQMSLFFGESHSRFRSQGPNVCNWLKLFHQNNQCVCRERDRKMVECQQWVNLGEVYMEVCGFIPAISIFKLKFWKPYTRDAQVRFNSGSQVGTRRLWFQRDDGGEV